MPILLLCIFLAQDAPADEKSAVTFSPITAGNVVDVGNFKLAIPEGVMFASEEDAPSMFGLAAANFIPNCAGIFFSASDSWQYAVVVQHVPFQAFRLEPKLPPKFFEEAFKLRHVYFKTPVKAGVQFLEPPQFLDDEHAFQTRIFYEEEGKTGGVYGVKAFTSPTDGVLLHLRAKTMDDYLSYQAEIDAIFQSVSYVPANEPTQASSESMETEPHSYLELIGLNLPVLAQNSEEPAAVSTEVWLLSAGLGIFAIFILVSAIRLQLKKNKAEA